MFTHFLFLNNMLSIHGIWRILKQFGSCIKSNHSYKMWNVTRYNTVVWDKLLTWWDITSQISGSTLSVNVNVRISLLKKIIVIIFFFLLWQFSRCNKSNHSNNMWNLLMRYNTVVQVNDLLHDVILVLDRLCFSIRRRTDFLQSLFFILFYYFHAVSQVGDVVANT